jgi:hypothetical protein
MNGANETLGLVRSDRVRRSARIDPREPQRFGRVNVADASDDALIQQRELDRDAPGGESMAEMGGIERRVDRIGAEDGRHGLSRVDQLHCGERTRICENHATAVVELEDESRKARKLDADALHDPIARHAKMHVQHRAIVEDSELVLAAPVDARDGPADESPQPCAAKAAPNVRMRHGRASDPRT